MNEGIEFSLKVVHGLVEEVGELLITEETLTHQQVEVMERRHKKQQELWEEMKHLARLRRDEKYRSE
jgi:predicted Zn-ribbon and HTH transcriptional regulator